MKTLALKKTLKPFFTASPKRVDFLTIPAQQFLAIDGAGDPNGEEFQNAVAALYSIAYTLKFMLKKGPRQIDYPVLPLEGLWWMKGKAMWTEGSRDDWRWTAMIMKPSIITPALVDEARELARKRFIAKKQPMPPLDRVALRTFEEGLCAQTMHIGPYAAERSTVDKMDAAAREAGYAFIGKHHEIYMNDPRRTKPEKLKTILRHAVKN